MVRISRATRTPTSARAIVETTFVTRWASVAGVDVVLRGIRRDEVASAVALIAEGTLSPGVEDARRLEEYWDAVLETRSHGGDVVVALDDDEVIGVCQLVVFRHFQRTAGWCAEVESVYVRSDQRGRGVGSALMGFVEEIARVRGCYRLQLTSRNERVDAHRFYRSLGYDQMSQGFKKSLVELYLTQGPVIDVEDETAHVAGVDEGART